jgi:hypothetical protein
MNLRTRADVDFVRGVIGNAADKFEAIALIIPKVVHAMPIGMFD